MPSPEANLADLVAPLRRRLATVYGDRAESALAALEAEFAELLSSEPLPEPPSGSRWNERDVVLITYADQLRDETSGATPLVALREWLVAQGYDELLSTVHLLPFCPYSSDDGFSVIDYLEVDPDAGSWDDIAALGEPFDLMFDLVLNHISQHSTWYQAYLKGEEPYTRFFVEADPTADYSQVVRPRSLPLLTPAEVNGETRHVWTTFSDDQIDLNYEEPLVLARMLRILVEYARRGARIIRLDAVAFLWKQLGTNCLHLAETHEIVKLMRDVLAVLAPRTLVLTETNVPHKENISYFGSIDPNGRGDEAHMVYQFSLPPLLLEAFTSGDATALRSWLTDLAPPPRGCTFFNFTASHDGVGVRPLEGLVDDDRLAAMVEAVGARGGKINTRRKPDGSDAPYELNITYVDAVSPTAPDDPAARTPENVDLHAARFLASQAVMLSLQGMPAVYFHSLVGTRNDNEGVAATGINRRINRHKYDRAELDAMLAAGGPSGDSGSLQRKIHDGYKRLLAARTAEPVFHPDVPQHVCDPENQHLLTLERRTSDGSAALLVAVNFANDEQTAVLPSRYRQGGTDLISGESIAASPRLTLAPGQVVWLRAGAG
ncbi:Sucrose phosphorylase [Pseudobythopirellula maris]|uniref:Sucrose phosphorylase n=1 Tax=Pseudobythopirellula maris TaxID=2527991 RepID=A0A5C5ZNN1_9BACT|nr:sugar phosphorylase [Pseudobythopirellula maris]TWT89059.1 Sucrose phosphorylase [Pseudobythopirellula maris]